MVTPESIEFNGRVYASWDDLPPEARDLIRSRMPDTNADGVPDALQGGPVPESTVTTSVTTSYEVDGTTYDSLEDVPAHLRPHLERGARDLAPGDSMTERVEGEPFAPVRQQTAVTEATPEPPRSPWWQRLLFGRS